MKKQRKKDLLPLGILALGFLGFFLRNALYIFALDEKNLLLRGHPLELTLWGCTAAAGVLLVLSGWKQRETACGSEGYFMGSLPAALGHILGACGILLTVLLDFGASFTLLGKLWRAAGVLSAVLLFWAAFDRLRGIKPFFGCYCLCSVFFALHLIQHYQLWCSDPQLQNYVFAFGAVMALMLFAYQQASLCVDSGKPSLQRLTGMAAVFLCLVAMSNTQQLYLYLGCGVWALTSLCPLGQEKGGCNGTS